MLLFSYDYRRLTRPHFKTPIAPQPARNRKIWQVHPPKCGREPSKNDDSDVPFGRFPRQIADLNFKIQFFPDCSWTRCPTPTKTYSKDAPRQALQNPIFRFRPNVTFFSKILPGTWKRSSSPYGLITVFFGSGLWLWVRMSRPQVNPPPENTPSWISKKKVGNMVSAGV